MSANHQTHYSHSETSAFRSCPKAYYHRFIAGLVKRNDEKSEHHLAFGHAMHAGIEVLYANDFVNQKRERRDDILQLAIEAFADNYPVQLDPDDNAKTQLNGIYTIGKYAAHYLEEDRKYRVLSCEAPDRFESGGVVHLDRVIENLETGSIYGLDTKCTGKYLNYDFFGKFEPNTQVNRYVDFIRERYGHCEGFIIDAICMKFRSRKYKDEPAGFWCKFERQMFNPNDECILQERANTAYWEPLMDSAVATGLYGYNTDSCWHCQYKQICTAGWEWPMDEQLISLHYRQTCRQMTVQLRHCTLEVGHQGSHAEMAPRVEAEEEFCVEV